MLLLLTGLAVMSSTLSPAAASFMPAAAAAAGQLQQPLTAHQHHW